MTGVEILATEQVAVAFGFDWTTFICCGALSGLLLALVLWGLSANYCFNIGGTIAMIIVGFLMGMIIGVVAGFNTDGAPAAYETHYKMLVYDEVPMNEFLERYEIVDQEGKIYTVRERGGSEDGK